MVGIVLGVNFRKKNLPVLANKQGEKLYRY